MLRKQKKYLNMNYGEIKAVYLISYWDVTSDYLYSPKVTLNIKNQ